MLDNFVGHHFRWDTECRVKFSIGGWSGLINGFQKEMSESSSPVPENVSLEIKSFRWSQVKGLKVRSSWI